MVAHQENGSIAQRQSTRLLTDRLWVQVPLLLPSCLVSSAVERRLDKAWVAGSIPALGTNDWEEIRTIGIRAHERRMVRPQLPGSSEAEQCVDNA